MRDPSVARLWNDVLLDAIRKDLARPTVHARNLFHMSAAMYDAWALYSDTATPYLAGTELHGYTCPMDGFEKKGDLHVAREEAISYAAYRIIRHRFAASPGAAATQAEVDALMTTLGYDAADVSTDMTRGSAAAVGNRIAECYIAYGLQDGANEANAYRNQFYVPVNPPIEPPKPGNPAIVDLDRWQPIALVQYIDQAGNVYNSNPPALSPEWGAVLPFALTDADKTTNFRDGFNYNVYHDPGTPPRAQGPYADIYKWTFALVAVWSGHLDQADGVMMDISPASNGTLQSCRRLSRNCRISTTCSTAATRRRAMTSIRPPAQPYEPQIVPRGGYARVLAEFWADGPSSETPPGHWFTILNTVADHDQFERASGAPARTRPLEWDVKTISRSAARCTTWRSRPGASRAGTTTSARCRRSAPWQIAARAPIRWAHYHPDGIPLIPGHIEVVAAGDPLAGAANENVGKIKLYAWRGPTRSRTR